MPKIKVRKVVEEEVDGAELIAQLRAEVKLDSGEHGFVPGDIVNLDTPKNREESETAPPTCAIVTATDVTNTPLCCAYYDDDGDLCEDEWFSAQGVELIEESPLRKGLTDAMTPAWAR